VALEVVFSKKRSLSRSVHLCTCMWQEWPLWWLF